MARRTFSPEYKQQAVNLVREQGLPVAQVARQLHVHENVLRTWVRDRCELGTSGVYPRSRPTSTDMAHLRQELRRITLERDLLARALGCLAGDLRGNIDALFDLGTLHTGDMLPAVRHSAAHESRVFAEAHE